MGKVREVGLEHDLRYARGMTLAPGKTLSFYEILGPLGAGGMGEVWRARDTKLGREVAIKVLPDELAADEDRGQSDARLRRLRPG